MHRSGPARATTSSRRSTRGPSGSPPSGRPSSSGSSLPSRGFVRFVRTAARCRVAGKVFVTTPNRWFPLDPHTLLPLVHWLPRGAGRERLLRARGFGDVLDPLGPKELAALFPFPVRVINTGLTLVAVGPS